MLPVWFLIGSALYDRVPDRSSRAGGARAMTTGVPLLDVVLMTMVAALLLGATVRGLASASTASHSSGP